MEQAQRGLWKNSVWSPGRTELRVNISPLTFWRDKGQSRRWAGGISTSCHRGQRRSVELWTLWQGGVGLGNAWAQWLPLCSGPSKFFLSIHKFSKQGFIICHHLLFSNSSQSRSKRCDTILTGQDKNQRPVRTSAKKTSLPRWRHRHSGRFLQEELMFCRMAFNNFLLFHHVVFSIMYKLINGKVMPLINI